MTQARKAERFRVALLAHYREPTMLDLREAECRDLSLDGMFISTPRPSPRGALIRFECESHEPAEAFRGTARVVWQRARADNRGPSGMGLRFVHLESGSGEALSRLLTHAQSQPAPASAPATARGAAALGVTQLGIGPKPRSTLNPSTQRGVGSDRPSQAAAGEATEAGAAAGGSDSDRAHSDRPPRDRSSERPPTPGGVEVVRAQAVVRLPTAAIGIPASDDVSSPDAARATDPGRPAGSQQAAWETPKPGATSRMSNSARELAEDAEMVEEVPAQAQAQAPAPELHERPSMAAMRPSYSPAASNRFMMVMVVGSGLLVAGVLAYYFGGPSVPISKPASASDGQASQAQAGADSTVYDVQVTTVPDGAQVSLAGQTRTAPAEFELPSFKPPLLVTAALAGRVSTSRELVTSDFARTGEHRLEASIVMALPVDHAAEAKAAEQTAEAETTEASDSRRADEHTSRHHSTRAHHADKAAASKSAREAPPSPTESEAEPAEDEPEAQAADKAPSAPASEGSDMPSALEQATACMLRGDNACVIRVLAGSAHSMKELEMLIETYRAMGDFAHAEHQMTVYVERFPSGRRAAEYRRLLAKSQTDTGGTASGADTNSAADAPSP